MPYGISKAAVNYINAKYAVEFREKGYTFLAISPGLVDTQTGVRKSLLPQSSGVFFSNVPFSIDSRVNKSARDDLIRKLKTGYPDWNGVLLLSSESAELVLSVIDKATPEDSGRFVSQYGDKRWL